MGNDEFLLRTGIEEYSISLRPFTAQKPSAANAALSARVAFELRFGLETGCQEIVSLARSIAAALDGSGPQAYPEHLSAPEVAELVNLLERELQSGRLSVRQNVVQSLNERP